MSCPLYVSNATYIKCIEDIPIDLGILRSPFLWFGLLFIFLYFTLWFLILNKKGEVKNGL